MSERPAPPPSPQQIAWAARHPDRAADELALRRERRVIRKDFGRVSYGTPETRYRASRVRQGALARLYEGGHICIDQLHAGVEIRAVYERLGRDVAIGCVSLETRVDQSRRGDGAFFERLGQVRAEVAYGRWRARVLEPGAVMAVICHDMSLHSAAAAASMHRTRLQRLVSSALDMWGDVIGDVVRQVDHDDLAIAHARLAR